MTFSIFDSKKFNNKNLGFDSLSQENINILLDANNQLRQARRIFCGVSGKTNEQYKHKFIASIQRADSSQFKEYSAAYRQDINNLKNQKWYERQQRLLNNHHFWQDLIQRFSAQAGFQLKQLRRTWSKQQDYAAHTSFAIKYIAEEIIPVFESYLELLKTEIRCKEKHLPEGIASAVKRYAIKLQLEIATEKQKICYAMLGRLEVASKKGHLTADDVTIDLAQNLLSLGIIKKDMQLPQPRENLTSSCFQFFHQFIEKQGNKPVKNRLKYLAWFCEDQQFITLKREGQHLIVPRLLASYVPLHDTANKFIFSGTHFRYHFFKNKLSFMSQIRWLENKQCLIVPLSEITNNSELKALNNLERELIREYQLTKARLSQGFFTHLFRRKTLEFSEHWQIFLTSVMRQLLDKKIKLLQEVAGQIKTQTIFGLDLELARSSEFQHTVEELFNTTEVLINQVGLETPNYILFIEAKTVIASFIAQVNVAQSNKCQLQEISEDEYLKTFPSLEALDLAPQQEKSVVLEKAQAFFKNFQQKSVFAQVLDNQEIISAFDDYADIINKEKDLSLKKLQEEAIENCFMDYLKLIIHCAPETYSAQLEKISAVLNLIAKHGTEAIQQRLIQLKDYVLKNQWYLVQIKSRSYLEGYGIADISKSVSKLDKTHLVDQKLTAPRGPVAFFKSSPAENNHQSARSTLPVQCLV